MRFPAPALPTLFLRQTNITSNKLGAQRGTEEGLVHFFPA